MSWSVTAQDGSVGSVTLAAGVTVLVVSLAWSTGSPTYCRWNGTDMTLIASIAVGGSTACGLWYINNPEIGTYAVTTDVSPLHGSAISITGTLGETAIVRSTDTNSHANNDWIAVSMASDDADLGVYAADKIAGGGWSGVDGSSNQGAYEVGDDAGIGCSWGDVDDQEITLVGASLQVKPLSGGNVILYL